jgi:hypothetical protein
MRSDPDESHHEAVNENEEFCCMFKSRLGDSSLLFGAEMDGFQLSDNCDSKSKDEVISFCFFRCQNLNATRVKRNLLSLKCTCILLSFWKSYFINSLQLFLFAHFIRNSTLCCNLIRRVLLKIS